MEQINREIQLGQRRVKLLKLEAQKIAKDIQLLRGLKKELVKSVQETKDVYITLQEEIREMVEFIPLLNEKEKKEIFAKGP